jgi:GT2 family glycosyltransferase
MTGSTRVVIVNYNAGDALQKSVASVLSSREPLTLIVADNASKDGSCEQLRSLYSTNERIEILENPKNLGFATAVNACSLNAKEPFLLILNPDCELYPGALGHLRQALEQDADAALAAPRVVDRQEQVLRGTLRSFPDPLKAFMTASGLWRLGRWLPVFRGVEAWADKLPTETTRTDAVSGACMLVRSEAFRQMGGFDEGFGLHFEDLDLMYRLRQVNRFCLYVPKARAFHQPGTSSTSRPWWVHKQKHSGMQRFFKKHYAGQCSLLSRGLVLTGIWLHYLIGLPLVLFRR